MKRTLLALSIAVLAFASCQKDKNYKLDVTPKTLSFEAIDAQSQVVTVTAENIGWDVEVSAEADWIDFRRQGNQITITVDDNTSADKRIGELIINSDVAGIPGVGVVVSQRSANDVLFRDGYAYYYGDTTRTDAGHFDMHLFSVESDTKGFAVGDGYALYLEFYSSMPSDTNHPDIPTGIYAVNDSHKKFTALPGILAGNYYEHSYVAVFEDGVRVEELGVSSGSFLISQENGTYVMELDLRLSDGKMLYGKYEGTLEVDAMR